MGEKRGYEEGGGRGGEVRQGNEARSGFRERTEGRDGRGEGYARGGMERETSRSSGWEAGRDVSHGSGRESGREYGREYGRESGREYGRESGREYGRDSVRGRGGYESGGGWGGRERRGEFDGRVGGRGGSSGGRDGHERWSEPVTAPTPLQRTLAADMDLLYGVTPVLAALRAGRRKAVKLFVQERKGDGSGGAGPARKAGHDKAVEGIMRVATALEVPVTTLPKGDLNVLARGRPHQGFVLQCTRLEYEDVSDVGPPPKAVPGAAAPVWLVLDEVTDPQNLGALVRSSRFLGAAGVVACRRNSSALTPAVSKASAGAVEDVPVRGVASMPRFLRKARTQGWRVVGAAGGEGAISAAKLVAGEPTLIVLGSEGRGLRPMVRAECDELAWIGGQASEGDTGDVDSLNVSVAGAVLLHCLLGT